MSGEPTRRVANPPPKPLMLFDDDCHFCRRWIERWRETTGDAVEYAAFQQEGEKFPEIARADFERAVKLIEADGRVFSAAEAVFRSRAHGGLKWPAWCYERAPGFAALTEVAYALIAHQRMLASAATRLLWGSDVRRPTYFIARHIFTRALGVVYLIAFVSLWTQIEGLVGSNGIRPVAEFLPAAREQLGGRAFTMLPTLCWLNASDWFLHLLCGAGTVLSLLLIAGMAPAVSLLGLFVFYLSLTIAGQTFLSFQWDILLLEAGFLAIFLAPWRWRMSRGREAPVSWIGLFLLKLLLFKLMFLSGVVKLTSGDEAWWDLSATNYHYATQPLPTVLGWWAHQGPAWSKQFATAAVLAVELAAPFLIWAPRRLRLVACATLIGLQIVIALTGNYAFFNLLTIALCLLLVDDAVWQRLSSRLRPQRGALHLKSRGLGARCSIIAATLVLLILLPLNAWLIFGAFKPEAIPPRAIGTLQSVIEPFRVANGYGLFRVMTKTRPEIVIEGSADGIEWLPYRFRWKPGDLRRAPRWVAPHQPRLDWQMWFAALGNVRQNQWFLRLVERLLHNQPEVTALLEHNPFPKSPPRYMRAILYDYQFTSAAERRETGAWWKRRELKEYLQTASLNQ